MQGRAIENFKQGNKPYRYPTKNSPVRGNNKGKYLEAGVVLAYSWRSKEASVAVI